MLILFFLFQALKLSDTHKKGKLCAYRLLCSITVTPQDIPPPRDYLIEFYRVLHKGLTCDDQVSIPMCYILLFIVKIKFKKCNLSS